MENLAEWVMLTFCTSFLAATIIPFSSELVLSILIAKNYDLSTFYLLHQLEIGLVGLVVI